ncbi:hypothetical protein EJ08DRAFT_658388 [Tothia fuscella]|uniref:Clr5 domain-containing protein n=1 Tax=Tothia fuscella TaxID=1048955 RepID=A0A9P4U018_9PEZI|nr:hypothetical protein EJ08DRAFT_658388 [Tothia fuscella]
MDEQTQFQWLAESTKKYIARIDQGAWGKDKDVIIEQYEKTTLDETRSWMKKELDLDVSENQLRKQLRNWWISKYATSAAEPSKNPTSLPKSGNVNMTPQAGVSAHVPKSKAKRTASGLSSIPEHRSKRPAVGGFDPLDALSVPSTESLLKTQKAADGWHNSPTMANFNEPPIPQSSRSTPEAQASVELPQHIHPVASTINWDHGDLLRNQVESLLEKELMDGRNLPKAYGYLFRLLLARLQSLGKKETACFNRTQKAQHRPYQQGHTALPIPKVLVTAVDRAQDTDFYPSVLVMSSPSRDRQLSKFRNRILHDHLPTLLSSSVFFDYDIFGLLKWYKTCISAQELKEFLSLGLKVRFQQHKHHPEIALASHLWEFWQRPNTGQRFVNRDSERNLEHTSESLESFIGPRTVGVDSVSVAELLVVVSSLLLADKPSKTVSVFRKGVVDALQLATVVNSNHANLIQLDTDNLYERLRERHILLIDRKRYRMPPESREELQKLVETCLNISLPKPLTNTASKSWKLGITSTFSIFSKPNLSPTLAESLRPSEDSSFRRFAATARRSISTPIS